MNRPEIRNKLATYTAPKLFKGRRTYGNAIPRERFNLILMRRS